MLFAEVDWTAIIQVTAASVVLVMGALFGWRIKVQSSEHKAKLELVKFEHELAKERDAEAAKLKAAEEAREEERERRDDIAEQKREKNVIGELRRLLDLHIQHRAEDRDELHRVRNDLQGALGRLQKCEQQREMQTRQLSAIFEHFDLRFVDAPDGGGKVIVVEKGSKEHHILTIEQEGKNDPKNQ